MCFNGWRVEGMARVATVQPDVYVTFVCVCFSGWGVERMARVEQCNVTSM